MVKALQSYVELEVHCPPLFGALTAGERIRVS